MLYHLSFLPSVVRRKFLVNHFVSFYGKTVKNSLKTKKMLSAFEKCHKNTFRLILSKNAKKKSYFKNNQYYPKHILYLLTNVSEHKKKRYQHPSPSNNLNFKAYFIVNSFNEFTLFTILYEQIGTRNGITRSYLYNKYIIQLQVLQLQKKNLYIYTLIWVLRCNTLTKLSKYKLILMSSLFFLTGRARVIKVRRLLVIIMVKHEVTGFCLVEIRITVLR